MGNYIIIILFSHLIYAWKKEECYIILDFLNPEWWVWIYATTVDRNSTRRRENIESNNKSAQSWYRKCTGEDSSLISLWLVPCLRESGYDSLEVEGLSVVRRESRGGGSMCQGDAMWDVKKRCEERRWRWVGWGCRRCWGGYWWGVGGYREECTLTFLACPPHCNRLMRRGREWASVQIQDKTHSAPAGTERLSSQLRNSNRRTWEGRARCQFAHTQTYVYAFQSNVAHQESWINGKL